MHAADDRTWTYHQYHKDVCKIAKSLLKLGMDRYDATNIIGFNCPEWFLFDIGTIFAGGMCAGVYTTSTADSCAYIAEDSKAFAICADGKEQVKKYLEIEDRIPHTKVIVVWNHCDCAELLGKFKRIKAYKFEDFLELGVDVTDETLKARMDLVKSNEAAVLIYTSGTTGNPKGVMISHDNLWYNCHASLVPLKITERDCLVSYLPLSHIAAQMLDCQAPLFFGSKVGFATPDALQGALVKSFKKYKPTVAFGVPRVWEKIMDKMVAAGAANKSKFVNKVKAWAKPKGAQNSQTFHYNSSVKAPSCLGAANKIFFMKVKKVLGFENLRFGYTGSAPLDSRVIEFFGMLNIQIYDCFGMSETTAPCIQNEPYLWKVGSVGKALKGVEIKILPENGELCVRGRLIFMGYLNMKDKTDEALDSEGWLHTGDKARVDEDGFVYITGRLKELIKTSGGENIPPVIIENHIKGMLPAISNAILVGDRKKFLAILLAFKSVMVEGEPTDDLDLDVLVIAESIGSSAKTVTAANSCPKFKEYVEKGIKRYNDEKKISKAQAVQKYEFLPSDLSVAAGDLTSTLKLKRYAVYHRYEKLIERLYEGGGD